MDEMGGWRAARFLLRRAHVQGQPETYRGGSREENGPLLGVEGLFVALRNRLEVVVRVDRLGLRVVGRVAAVLGHRAPS